MKSIFYKYAMTLAILSMLLIPNALSMEQDSFLNNKKSLIVTDIRVIISVDDDGDEDYTKIQDAIDNASSGDTILVFSGTYKETLTIDKQLYLMGTEENEEGLPIIDAEGYEYAVSIDADSCLFQGFKVINSSKNDVIFACIKILSDNNKLRNNTIIDNYNGIWLTNSNNNYLSNNNISKSNFGIFLLESSNNTITNNQINTTRMNINSSNGGIYTWYHSNNNIIFNNTIECDFNGDGIIISESLRNKISNNTISSYSTSDHNNFILQYGFNGILLQLYSHNNEVINNNISGYFTASQIWDSNENLFTQNYISNNLMGLYLYKSHKNFITCNNFINNSFPLEIFDRIPFKLIQFFLKRLLSQHATFCSSFFNRWNDNYWDDWSSVFPKPIKGIIERSTISIFYGVIPIPSPPTIPLWNIDWHPAKEPYDI
jgi:parallel beta-helix repeat protein